MLLTPIQVECYAGMKADETPRRFQVCRHSAQSVPEDAHSTAGVRALPDSTAEEQMIAVTEILDRWYQVESQPEWPRANYFKVRGDDHREYLLKHDLELDEWYLGKEWPQGSG